MRRESPWATTRWASVTERSPVTLTRIVAEQCSAERPPSQIVTWSALGSSESPTQPPPSIRRCPSISTPGLATAGTAGTTLRTLCTADLWVASTERTHR
jgi:hypothetical protein